MAGSRGRYMPALDGLRAFAVLAVIAYHMGLRWAQGGLLGVTIFFVLSGYLITGLLISEFKGSGTIDLPHFWLRRIKRLVPAIVFVVIAVAALCTVFNHMLLTKMRPDIVPSLFFFSNWWQILHDVSYFEALGAPSPLQHFWSLAIEEQFYLVWPPLLLLLFKTRTDHTYIRRGILIVAIVSAIEMALLYTPTGDPSRIYYGTDTRAFSLLIGAWLSFVWPCSQLPEDSGQDMPLLARVAFDAVGVAAFAGLCALVALSNGFDAFPYRGGIMLCSVLAAVMMGVIAHPASIFGRFWALRPLVWIGQRSYGMYLWHFPILLLTTNANSTNETPWWWRIMQLALIFAVSAFSYHFIEDPIRHGALGTWFNDLRSGRIHFPTYIRERIVPFGGAAVLMIVCIGGVALVPAESGIAAIEELKQADQQQQVAGEQEPASDQAEENTEEASAASADEGAYDVILIGDSVSVRTIPFFQATFPNGMIDAAVNRQMLEGQSIYDNYRASNAVGPTVVFALGTNGPVDAPMIDSLIADIGPDKQVYFVNTRSSTDWMVSTNESFAEAQDRYDNVGAIDWFSYSAGHDDWFDGDGTHLTETGAQAYIELIRSSLNYTTPDTNKVGETASDDYGISITQRDEAVLQ